MNLITRNSAQRPLNQRLFESYESTKTAGKQSFAGSSDLYDQLRLNESFQQDNQFQFDNQMSIMNLNSPIAGRLSMTELSKGCSDSKHFVTVVNESICQSVLGFDMNESEKQRLEEHFDQHNSLNESESCTALKTKATTFEELKSMKDLFESHSISCYHKNVGTFVFDDIRNVKAAKLALSINETLKHLI